MSNPYQHALRQQKNFWQLQFSPELEREFMQYRLDYYIPRIRILAYTAVAMILMYSYMDYVQFTGDVLMHTISVRLFIDVPLILIVLFASYHLRNPIIFYKLFSFAYFVNGLSILFILLLSHMNGIELPYEGLFLLLMFGYFLLGLPVLHSTLASITVSAGYVVGEYLIGTDSQEIFYAFFFLASANVVGIVGAYLLERLSRANFLYLSLARLGHEEALTDVNNRSRFIAAASHDLRQPIHAIGLMIDRLRHHPDEVEKTTPRLHQAHEQLNELLTSLLDISRLDFGLVAPNLSDVQLSRLLAMIPNTPTIRTDVDANLWVKSDGALLSRVLGNLVTNALRHSQATRIEVLAKRQGESVILTVKDNGIGMDEKTRSTIFSPYERGNHDQQGLGLGLAIVKEICSLMNIPLTFHSAPQQGCVFTLTLPAVTPKPIPKHKPLPEKSLQVLLLEDDYQQRLYVEALLKDWGHQVVTPKDLYAVGEANVENVDLILADYELGQKVNGLQWIHALRQQRPELPALLVSASGDRDLPTRCKDMQVSFLPKPVTPVSLRIWLERH